MILANCLLISVLPTPVGPVNRKEPMVLVSSLNPTLDNLIALEITLIALSWPKMTLFKLVSISLRLTISSLEIFLVGILVIKEIVFSISSVEIFVVFEFFLFKFIQAPVSSITSNALSGKYLSFIYLFDK